MNFHYFLLLCFIAAVQGESSKCDLKCIADHGHSYTSGKSYIYKYETRQSISSQTVDQAVNITAEISITPGEGEKQCQLTLNVLSWKAVFPSITAGDNSEQVINVEFNEPATFSYINGAVTTTCLPADDPWKNNIRRSLFSLFQTDLSHLKSPESAKDNVETGLTGSSAIRYHKFSDPHHLSKVAMTSSSLQKFWTASGKPPHSTFRSVFSFQDGLENFDPGEFGSKPSKSFQDLVSRYTKLLEDTHSPWLTLDSVEICGQDFEATKIKRTECVESRSHDTSIMKSQLNTRTYLTLDRVLDKADTKTVGHTHFTSTLEFDANSDKPSSDPKILESFEKNVRENFCRLVPFAADAEELLEFSEILKKLIKKISKAELEKNYDFVKDVLDCGFTNRGRQTEMYLHFIAMAPTDDSVEFLVEQSLKGNVPVVVLKSFLLSLTTMEFPGPRSLNAMGNLLSNHKNLTKEVRKFSLLLAASSIARTCQNSLLSTYRSTPHEPRPDAAYPELTELLQTIILAAQDLDRLAQMEVLRGLRDFSTEQNLVTCEKLAKDDFERLQCQIPCKFGETTSSNFARDLLVNETAQSGTRIAAWLYIAKCLSKAHLDMFSNQVNILNPDVKDFINSYSREVLDMDTDTDSAELSTVTRPLGAPYRSRTMARIQEYGNWNVADQYEGHVVFGASWIPRLISVEISDFVKNQVYRCYEIEIKTNAIESASDSVEVLLSLRRYGETIDFKSLSIQPSVYLKRLENKDALMGDILRLFAGKIPQLLDLLRDRSIEYFRFIPSHEKPFLFPTISGLPFQGNTGTDTFTAVNFAVDKLAKFGNPAYDTISLDVSPNFNRKRSEKNFMGVGCSEIIGYEFASWKHIHTGISLSLSKPKSGFSTFRIGFAKTSNNNDDGYIFDKKEDFINHRMQLLGDYSKYQKRAPNPFEPDIVSGPHLLLFGTMSCTDVRSVDTYFRTSNCTCQDWFFTTMFKFDDPETNFIQLKLHPSEATKQNTFSVTLGGTRVQEPDFGHEVDIEIESPYKDMRLKWNVTSIKESLRSQKFFNLTAVSGESEFALAAYAQSYHKSKDHDDTDGLLFWTSSNFGVTLTTPSSQPLNAHFEFGKEKAVVSVRSYGIHKPFDSKLNVELQEIKHDSGKISYNITVAAENAAIGKFSTDASAFYEKVGPQEEVGSSISVEYGNTEPFHTISIKTLETNTVTSNQSDKSIVMRSRSSQFPACEFDYKFERKEVTQNYDLVKNEVINSADGFEEQVSVSQKLTRLGLPEQSVGITLDRSWKNLRFISLMKSILNSNSHELANTDTFNIKNVLQVLRNGKPLGSVKLDARREDQTLKYLDFRFKGTSEKETTVHWESDGITSSFKAEANIKGISHKTQQHVNVANPDQWTYKGEYARVPGKKYTTSGTLTPSKETSIGFSALDVSVLEIKNYPVTYLFTYKNSSSVDVSKYSTKLTLKFPDGEPEARGIEYSTEIDKAKHQAKIILFLNSLVDLELELLLGSAPKEINFVTRLIPLDLKINGSIVVNPDIGRTNPAMKTTVDWSYRQDLTNYGHINSEVIVDPEADGMIQSRTLTSIKDRWWNLTVLSLNNHNTYPLIYIDFIDPNGQKYGLNLTITDKAYREPGSTTTNDLIGFSLKCERPGVEPFVTVGSVKMVKDFESEGTGGNVLIARNFTSSLHFCHRDDVLYLGSGVDTEWNWTGDFGWLYNGFKTTMNTKFVTEDSPMPVFALRSYYEVDSKEGASDIKFDGFVQKQFTKFDLNGIFQHSKVKRDDGMTLRKTASLMYEFSSMAGIDGVQKKMYDVIGSHNFTAAFVSFRDFEAQLVHNMQCEPKLLEWTDTLKRTYDPDAQNIKSLLRSSKIFEIETLQDQNSLVANISVLAQSLKSDITVDFKCCEAFNLNRPGAVDDDNGFSVDLKGSFINANTAGLNFIFFFNLDKETDVWTKYKLAGKGFINQKTGSLELISEEDVSPHATSLKEFLSVEFDDSTGAHQVYRYSGASVIGEAVGIAEILHSDYAIDWHGSIINGSFTITTPAHLPILFESVYTTNIKTLPLYSETYSGYSPGELVSRIHHLVLLGKVPEFNCAAGNSKTINLLTLDQFPFDPFTLTKLAQTQLYCKNYESVGAEAYSAFRKKDVRLINTFSITNDSGADLGHRSETFTIALDSESEHNRCTSNAMTESTMGYFGRSSKDLSRYCNLAIKALPTCWTHPGQENCPLSPSYWPTAPLRDLYLTVVDQIHSLVLVITTLYYAGVVRFF